MSPNPLIQVEELVRTIDSESTVIVDCRFALADAALGLRHYQAAHIRGAHFLDLAKDLSGPLSKHGGRHPLPMVDTFVERLREIGVCADSRVVVYDESRLAFAARLWLLLRYLGHETVHVLNGGFAAWREAGLPVASETPRAKRGNFAARLVPELLIDRPALLALVKEPDGNTVIVDARERKRYRGDEEPIDRIAGHIPGAVCYPWQDTTTAEGRVISTAANRERWSAVSPTTPIVVYCGSGVTACADILSLERAGFSKVKLYAGSWSAGARTRISRSRPATSLVRNPPAI